MTVGFFTIILLILIFLLMLASFWKTLEKAGKPGWITLVPFYNLWTLSEIGSLPGWWGLFIIFSYDWLDSKETLYVRIFSFFCFIFYVQIIQGVSRNFKKKSIFSIVLALLPFIGYPILGFGQSKYKVASRDKSKKNR
ncbi:MAG TPA: DUF5684 domain-containing protein [Candidatus Saccharimonadales bacterium]|nr:DUF5684 domain-containing protein [Candidatus Saccharimonadales bacterium]